MKQRFRYLFLLAALPMLAFIVMLARGNPARPTAEMPVKLVEGVSNYVVQEPKIFYSYEPSCGPVLAGKNSVTEDLVDIIGRIAIFGAIPRHLFEHTFDCPPLEGDIFSNVVADDDYVYWLSNSAGGIVRLSEDAFPTDTPELVAAFPVEESELVLINGFIYLIQNLDGDLFRLVISSGLIQPVFPSGGSTDPVLDLATDGTYLYWRSEDPAAGDVRWLLKRYPLAGGGAGGLVIVSQPAPGVLSYDVADDSSGLYIGFENVIRFYSTAGSSLSPPKYTSDISAQIAGIAADADAVYFIRRSIATPFGGNQLYRLPLAGGALALLHTSSTSPGEQLFRLRDHDGYLFFLEASNLMRLRADLGVPPPGGTAVINMQISGIEITQAIQTDDNRVPLVQGRRTAVRLFVESDGAAIPGVTAELYRINGAGAVLDGPLLPLNLVAASSYLTVQSAPSRDNIDESFLFMLPPGWTDGASIRLRAELNPYHYPTEPDYSDNTLTTSTFPLEASSRLQSHFVLFEYDSGGTRYRPRFREDYMQALSWMRRTYPLASTSGWADDPSPGLRPNSRYLFADALGGNVDGTNRDPRCICRLAIGTASEPAFCAGLDLEGGGYMDDADMCSAYYVTMRGLAAIRAAEGIDPTIFLYGMVADDAGFPRGTAGVDSSVGPSGPTGTRFTWDDDGSYADWYTGHEIGHPQNRGHAETDPLYPYEGELIGGDATIRGFDVGEMGLNILLTPRVYPSNMWTDVMSYRPNQWISDYTYEAILAWRSVPHPLASAPSHVALAEHLQLSGLIWPEAGNADITQSRRWQSLPNPPLPPQQGDYRIRLLKSNGDELAAYSFDPDMIEDSTDSVRSFDEIVPFAADTARIVISHQPTAKILWKYEISPNSPTVSQVSLGAVNPPVMGKVTLQWTGDDKDNDPLTYDVLYSTNGGNSWQIIQMGLSGSPTEIDTALLAGSTLARFKVIANDSLNQGEGLSPTYDVARKKPTIVVTSPFDGINIPYGVTLPLAAEVYDLQDESVKPADIQWHNQHGHLLGSGLSFATSDLLIGINDITVKATNSFGLSETAKFTVLVNDDLAIPGKVLGVGPDRINWNTTWYTPTLHTAAIRVVNTGSGKLTAVVSENAPWLSVKVVGSAAPYTVELSADPTQVPHGQAVSTTLIIKSSGDNGDQTVKVPVTLSRGAIWGPGKFEIRTQYLPMLSNQ